MTISTESAQLSRNVRKLRIQTRATIALLFVLGTGVVIAAVISLNDRFGGYIAGLVALTLTASFVVCTVIFSVVSEKYRDANNWLEVTENKARQHVGA